MSEQLKNRLTRREFLQRAAILGLSASAIALLDGCGIFAAPTPTPTPKIHRIGWLTITPLGSPTPYFDVL